jgi:hypothetical protein
VEGYSGAGGRDVFAAAREALESEIAWLGGLDAGGCEHAALERRMAESGRELQRLLLQAHLELRAQREVRLGEVVDADGAVRSWGEVGRATTLASA